MIIDIFTHGVPLQYMDRMGRIAPIEPSIKAIERLKVSSQDRKRLFGGNAERLMTR